MPELPEVETVRRGLIETVQGAEITHINVKWPRIVQDEFGIDGFAERMVGQVLDTVERRGKFLFFYWTTDGWISHLRMEGKWLVVDQRDEPDAYTHVIIDLADGRSLRYRDVRKFGRIHRVARDAMPEAINALQLGPEPSELTLDYLRDRFQRTTRVIKNVLLDQTVIAGIGNIYCDESLWLSQIHPERPANDLSDAEIERLRQAIQSVISRAVDAGGTTIRTYQNTFGENGYFQLSLKVYGKAGEPCSRCGTVIEKIKVHQHGTSYCPHCQTLEEIHD